MAKIIHGQTIRTKWFCERPDRSARIKAFANAGTITIDCDSFDMHGEAHAKAAQALADKLGWTEPTHGRLYGGIDDGKHGVSYVFIFIRPEDLLGHPTSLGGCAKSADSQTSLGGCAKSADSQTKTGE